MPTKQYGRTEPRLWTRPLRELTPETSLGFEVIEFALVILGIELYPWQQWLLIHALELREDGQYRFKKVVVLVARQQGKTTLASVLAAWWLFVDSNRHPEVVPPLKFKVVGVAQNLDIAREPWSLVKLWCDPKPETEEESDLALPALQSATAKVTDTNGKEQIMTRKRSHYEIRAAKNARGKPAARVLMDELREQKDWMAWNAVSQTTKSFWSGLLMGFSNAGDAAAVVLRTQRGAAMSDLKAAGLPFDADAIEAGLAAAEAHANGEDVADTSLGLFEWSAPPGCSKADIDGILQANPSIGYGTMTVADALADIRGMTDAGYRTEVLCQWVLSRVDSYLNVDEWRKLHVPASSVKIRKGSRTVWGIDTSSDRSTTWIAAAVFDSTGKPFVTVRTKRAGMLWVVDYMVKLAKESGCKEVVIQNRGVPAVDLIVPLQEAGLTVHDIDGSTFALATGRIHDRVRDRRLVLVHQPDVDQAVQGGVVMNYGENKAWHREKSLPVDISGLVAESNALYGLEELEPEALPPTPPPPPQAEVVPRDDVSPRDANLATAAF